MGAKLSRLADSIAMRTRRSSSIDADQASREESDETVETGHDPAVHGAKLEDRNYNNEAYQKRPADPHEAQQKTAAATTIQTQFRQQMAKEEVGVMRHEDAAIKIQAGFRGFQGREQVRQIKEGQNVKADEEDIDIDLTSPEIEKAAIRIQAGFKGFKARKELTTEQGDPGEDTPTEASPDQDEGADRDLTGPEAEHAATKIQAGFRGHSARKQLKEQTDEEVQGNQLNDEKVEDDLADVDLSDPDLSKAALKIQAGFRGLKSRKELLEKKDLRKQEEEEPKAEEIVDIDLNDPDVEKSALMIQAGFKGLKARKELRKKAEEKHAEEKHAEEQNIPENNDVADQDDTQTDGAAVKIQAAFRGYTTRKSMNPTTENQSPEAASTHEDNDDDKKEPVNEEEEVDIDLTDPEVQKATIKLQAGFKGFMARKQMLAQEEASRVADTTAKEDDEVEGQGQLQPGENAVDEVGDETAENDDSRDKAAVTIQRGFRGMKTRKEFETDEESGKEDDQTHDDKEDAEEKEGHRFEDEQD